MCIVLTTNGNKDYPFVLLSNRDEYFKRPTQQVSLLNLKGHRVLAPLDLSRNGTWIAIDVDNKKFATLVNFREGFALRNKFNAVSRGVLSIDYVTSTKSTDKREFLDELSEKYDGLDVLSKTGGFNLLFGNLIDNKYDIISNKNDSDFKIFEEQVEYHGLSNSSFNEPWKKVEIGQVKLRELTENYNNSTISTKDELIDDLFSLLSYDTMGNPTDDYKENYENIKKSIFIPPLVNDEYDPNDELVGKWYGTRTQTIVLVDKFGKLTYIEKNLHSSDDLDEEPTIQKYEFDL